MPRYGIPTYKFLDGTISRQKVSNSNLRLASLDLPLDF